MPPNQLHLGVYDPSMSLRSSIVQQVPSNLLVWVNRHPKLKKILRAAGESGTPKGVQEVELPTGPCRGAHMTLDFDSTERHIWLGTYEPWVEKVLPTVLAPDSVVWDVGAHMGYYLIFASRYSNAELLAIEADPANILRLRKHLSDNGVRVEVLEAAVSNNVGTMRFDSYDNGALSRISDEGDLEISAVTLDAVLEGHPAPSVVIMDIEGAEDHALHGAVRLLSEIRPTFMIELHGEPGLAAYRQLEAAGYQITSAEGGDIAALLTSTARHARTHILAVPVPSPPAP
jgi:FkbM family methyltransferase